MGVQKAMLPRKLATALKAEIQAVGVVAPDVHSKVAVLASPTVLASAHHHGQAILQQTLDDWKVQIMASWGFAMNLRWADFVSCLEGSVLFCGEEFEGSQHSHDVQGAKEVAQVFLDSSLLVSLDFLPADGLMQVHSKPWVVEIEEVACSSSLGHQKSP